MICFEVRLNGKLVCTAGMGERGVTTASLYCAPERTRLGREPEDLPVRLNVGGVDSDSNAHLAWLSQSLRLGDCVLLKVVDREEPDPPAQLMGSGGGGTG